MREIQVSKKKCPWTNQIANSYLVIDFNLKLFPNVRKGRNATKTDLTFLCLEKQTKRFSVK